MTLVLTTVDASRTHPILQHRCPGWGQSPMRRIFSLATPLRLGLVPLLALLTDTRHSSRHSPDPPPTQQRLRFSPAAQLSIAHLTLSAAARTSKPMRHTSAASLPFPRNDGQSSPSERSGSWHLDQLVRVHAQLLEDAVDLLGQRPRSDVRADAHLVGRLDDRWQPLDGAVNLEQLTNLGKLLHETKARRSRRGRRRWGWRVPGKWCACCCS
mmetsp:Transcript_17499/g.44846  ORF Transcript_17499/g.44846 Transcript_17499/m.44846 type:complete len:212 (+) Transcript_17499:97-732(+)